MSEDVKGAVSLEEVASGLRALNGDIDSLAVVSAGGEVLFSGQPEGVDRQRAQAMLSALSGLAKRTARESGRDSAEQLRVKTEAGNLVMVRVSGGAMVAATAGAEARVGLILYDLRNARDELTRALEARSSDSPNSPNEGSRA